MNEEELSKRIVRALEASMGSGKCVWLVVSSTKVECRKAMDTAVTDPYRQSKQRISSKPDMIETDGVKMPGGFKWSIAIVAGQ